MSIKKNKKVTKKQDLGFEQTLYSGLKIAGVFVAAVFATANVAVLQSNPAEFYNFLNKNNDALVTLVHKTQDKPSFLLLYEDIKKELRLHDKLMFADYEERQANIRLLESYLKVQRDSPRLLQALSILYEKQGLPEESNKYLEEAKLLDPSIK